MADHALLERNQNARPNGLRKVVRFEAERSPDGVGALMKQVEQLKLDFATKVEKLGEETKEKIDAIEAQISARSENWAHNSENRVAPACLATETAAESVPYEESEFAAMVSEFARGSVFCGSPESRGSSDSTSEGVVSSPERSPAVKWSVASDTPLAPFGLPARVRCLADQHDRCLPQAPLHEPPRGPVRAVSCNLPEADPAGGALSRTCSRTLLSVDGPRSARESRPALAVPSQPSSARSDVARTRLAVETRPAVGGLSSPRRLGRLQPGPVVTSVWGAPYAPRSALSAVPAARPAVQPALQAPPRQPARAQPLRPAPCAVLRR